MNALILSWYVGFLTLLLAGAAAVAYGMTLTARDKRFREYLNARIEYVTEQLCEGADEHTP